MSTLLLDIPVAANAAPAPDGAGAVLSCMLLISLAAALIALSFVDARSRHIPNVLSASVALLSVGQMALHDVLGLSVLSALVSCFERIAWAAILVVGLTLCETAWRALHSGSHGMGAGDIKLIGALTLWVGPAAPYALIAACILGTMYALVRRRRNFAFGPFLALAFGTCLLVVLS